MNQPFRIGKHITIWFHTMNGDINKLYSGLIHIGRLRIHMEYFGRDKR
jgi:hypothetical protein